MTTNDGNHSPISQLLTTLGLTREDLQQRSDEMRQFLTTENGQSSRVRPRGRADSAHLTHTSSQSRSNSIISTSALSLSRASSISFRDASPPVTPVKSEPLELGLPHRQFDSMDIIIERQRQARKEKRQRKEKERNSRRRSSISHGSPTPSSASSRSLVIDSLLQRRDDDQMDVKGQLETMIHASMEGRSPPPLTPQQSRYYREHTVSQSKMLQVVPKVESPAQTPGLSQQSAPQQPKPLYPLPDTTSLTALQALVSGPPMTPQIRRVQTLNNASERSPLPPSSPFPSSPQSSPVRPIVNFVSSPGPMGPPPGEESYGKLPYTLPSGPYSPNKPDLSYAALLGQAILSSSDHRLTLQEIYDWITIVYPFFKRGETTWMNSIRHVLSTTACFRKVTRDRTLGRTQWAIWDEDLECFKGGGFRKQFCKDMNSGKNGAEARTKRGRKQVDDSDGIAERKPKKAKKDCNFKDSDKGHQRAIVSATTIFPPTRPAPPLQPYRDASAVQSLTSEVFFPPLPTESGFRQIPDHLSSRSHSRAHSHINGIDGDDGMRAFSPTSSVLESQYTDPSSSASTSSVPDLTPNCSSSSPPPSRSEIELEAPIQIADGSLCLAPSATVAGLESDEEETLRNMFSTSKSAARLTPVQFWGDSPRIKERPKLGGKLNFVVPTHDYDDDSEDEDILFNAVKSKNRSMLAAPFDRLPPSPTNRRATTKGRKSKAATAKARGSMRLSTPPRPDNPTTPPPNATLQISPVRTPLSHKGLHMSPSASLAHYKSHLDPPPTLQYDQSSSPIYGGTPSTPKRSLAFPLFDDSPSRTSLIGMSPFRTPGSGGLFDPHDPRTLLDEEFRRIGAGGLGENSPASGLFGKERQLLYDSPSGLDSSPGKYKRWW
ncbi:hypothetical protein J3R30DRAFT_738253 [Lentinula aciculospora]|uniref:Fork-head domain-containing protein n=1 Tax=Lentinula aciculospora TaxID=153920 RepID=A0A9W9A592_9AGAR|nr:hypothetical protein J3R30DRAFT_738253 [Lentinula aciculospora]